jgi:hypothetical protein
VVSSCSKAGSGSASLARPLPRLWSSSAARAKKICVTICGGLKQNR